MTDVVRDPPFVGEDGADAHGYPLRRPDQVALVNALRLKRFTELERWLAYYQDEFESDFRKELWPDDAVSAFYVADAELQPVLDVWVESAPGSFAPWLARGSYRHRVGWHHRGNAFANETSEKQFESMRKYHEAASADFERALELRPRLVAAHRRLLLIASTETSQADRKLASLAAATEACELCFEFRASHLRNLTPRWGGSLAEMERYARDVMPLAWSNPKLGVLAGFADAERCREHRRADRFREAHRTCDAALIKGEHPDFLVEKARILRDEERHAEALELLDRALRLAPHHRDALERRSWSRSKQEDYVGAAEDLVAARHLDPTDDALAKRVDWMVKMLSYQGDQLYKAGDHTEAAAYFSLGLQLAPDDKDLLNRQAWNEKTAGVDDLMLQLAGAPDDLDLRLRVDHGLAASRRFGEVVQMWDEFLARHPEDPRAYRERAGAKWHLGLGAAAVRDMQRACDLEMAAACDDLQRMRR